MSVIEVGNQFNLARFVINREHWRGGTDHEGRAARRRCGLGSARQRVRTLFADKFGTCTLTLDTYRMRVRGAIPILWPRVMSPILRGENATESAADIAEVGAAGGAGGCGRRARGEMCSEAGAGERSKETTPTRSPVTCGDRPRAQDSEFSPSSDKLTNAPVGRLKRWASGIARSDKQPLTLEGPASSTKGAEDILSRMTAVHVRATSAPEAAFYSP